MDKKKLENYKKNLLKLKQDLSKDIHNMSHNNGEGEGDLDKNAGHVQHMADVATDMYDREFTLGLASNDRELLYEIDGALGRIQEGTYGICVECKKSVPATRLKAVPHASLCLKCQEKLEAKKK